MRPNLSEVMKLVSDNSLAREKMNWSPEIALDEGLLRTIEFVKAHQDAFKSDAYVK